MADIPTKHALTEAAEDQIPPAPRIDSSKLGGPPGQSATPDQVAEEARCQQEARSHGRSDRDDYLVNVGRGQETDG